MARFNVLVTASTYPRWLGDNSSPFIHELSRRLADEDFNLFVLAPHHRGAARDEILDGVRILRFRYLPEALETLAYDGGIPAKLEASKAHYLQIPFFLLAQLQAIGKIIKRENIDIIFCHWLIPQGFIAALYRQFFNRNIRILCTAHGSDLLSFDSSIGRGMKRFALRHAQAVTVVSRNLKREVERYRVPDKAVHVIPMGIDMELFSPEKYSRDLKSELGITGPFCLFVGRLSHEKGILSLVEAFPAIAKAIPDARLVVVGEGPLYEAAHDRVVTLGLQGHVLFRGFLDHSILASYYATADVLIAPSVREGIALAIAEAMACGCCVVASDLPGLRDYLEDGVSGLLVRSGDRDALADAVVMILRDEPRRSRIRARARSFVADYFRWPRIIGLYRDTLLDLLKLA